MSTQLALPMDEATQLAPARTRGMARPRASAASSALTYEAASHSRRARNWNPPTIGPNDSSLFELTALRARSRLAVRNDGYAKGVIDRLVSNIIGTGIRPRSQAQDMAIRKKVQSLWAAWCEVSDAYGQLDFYGQQSQACRSWLEGGEVFVRLRPRLASDGLPVPLQLEIIEAELCPTNYTMVTAEGNRIRAGIEHDKIGRRVAYWFYAVRPGDFQDFDQGDLRRVPAEFVMHVYNPLRPGQLRGLPHLTQALVKLYELDKYDDATLLRQQIGNLFAGFLTRPVGDDMDLNPLTGKAADGTEGGRDVVSLGPGIMQELAPGETIDFSDPPDPPLTYPSFMKQQLLAVSAASGVPYEVLTGDLAGLNDRVLRVVLNEFRRGIMAYQDHVMEQQLLRRVWESWFDRAFLSSALPIPDTYLADPKPWSAVEWSTHAWPYLHPVQDVQAQSAAIKAGFTSRTAVVSEQGQDAETIDEEQAQDNTRADGLALKYESDYRTTVAAKAAAGAPPSGGPPAAPQKEGN